VGNSLLSEVGKEAADMVCGGGEKRKNEKRRRKKGKRLLA
jgi:hypothetical protein